MRISSSRRRNYLVKSATSDNDKVDNEAFLRQHAPRLETVGEEAIHFSIERPARSTKRADVPFIPSRVHRRGTSAKNCEFSPAWTVSSKRLIDNALARLKVLPDNAPSVCLLDTGLNELHPLLQPVADPADMHSYIKPLGQ
jgi:hypothetical protein